MRGTGPRAQVRIVEAGIVVGKARLKGQSSAKQLSGLGHGLQASLRGSCIIAAKAHIAGLNASGDPTRQARTCTAHIGEAMAQSWYDRHLLPRLLDLACGSKPVRKQREKVVPLASGDVLEVGMGTGLNVPFYDKARVRRIVGVDPAQQMHRLALRRIRAAGLPVELVGLSAERLPLADASFDSVVCTYTLCSIPEPLTALREIRRVLKPGGRLLFSEHGVAPDESVQRWQRRLQPIWGPLAGGCQLSLDVPAELKAAGFASKVQSRYIPGPKFASFHYWGEAVACS